MNWRAPTNLGIFTEKSFAINLNDIDKVISKKPWADSQIDHELDYSILLKDGSTIPLSLNSGIPIGELIEILVAHGVKYESRAN